MHCHNKAEVVELGGHLAEQQRMLGVVNDMFQKSSKKSN